MTMPVWKGEGNPVEMWLLQLDLANHSRWTHELNSYPDAFRHRREFAHAVEAALAQHDFCRLAWAGDGGVFAADGRKSVTSAIEGATSVHETFQGWRNTARLSDCLGIHVSVHRALVTTADDPSYCFGMDLNEFVKRERDLRDQSADHTTTITSAVFRLLTHEQQTGWVLLSESVGTLGTWVDRVTRPLHRDVLWTANDS